MSLSAEDLAKMIEIDKKNRAKLTEEQNASNKAKLAELMADQEKMQAAMASQTEIFAAADKDGDGKLNWEEYQEYTAGAIAKGTEKGWHVAPHDEADLKFSWEAYCRAGGDTSGVTQATIFAAGGQVMAAMKAAESA